MNKSRLEIFYSISILIIIPFLIAFNTILLATSVRKDYDQELQSRAELANSVVAISLQEYVTDDQKDFVQEKIRALKEAESELRNVAIITREDGNYAVFAADSDEYTLSESDTLQYDIVFSRKRSVAKNIPAVSENGTSTRAWSVASPIVIGDETVGLVVSDFLTIDVDEKFDATLSRSMIIMIISAVAVIILLFNHFRFIGYASLLRKQKEVNQTMNDFLSVATHELKAPMTIIKGYIANVVDGDYGDVSAEAQKQLNVAIAQTDRLNELVQDLLNVSRIEQGRIQFRIESVNVTEIIKTIAKSYESIAAEKDIKISYDHGVEDVWVQADSGRIQEIFTNLIDNAVKYSKQGDVDVTHRDDGKVIVTSVRDTGIGMSSDERGRLFQRFYRVKNENTKSISGTGLGLWIIKQYIEKMNGKIQVDSLVGVGSEFQVSLPKAQPHTQSQTLSESSPKQ